jgi:DNA-binding transcriptional ArsR family regulator
MMQGEMKVGEIVECVNLSQSALSQHLTKLREEGLVEFRRESQTLYYRIADPRIFKLIKLLKKLYCEDGA